MLGPYIVFDCTGIQVTVRTLDGTNRQMYIAFQMKPHYKDIQEKVQLFTSNPMMT